MCKNPKLSIIIPVYNVEKYVAQALNSVINQTFKDFEVIIVNDQTPDNSMQIVEEFVNKDERFVIINQETNQGQGVARNRALDIACGEYIMFLDPDDWLELDACEKAYNQISKNQNEIVFFNLYSIKERNGKLGKRKLNTTRLKPFEEVKDNPHINLQELNTNWFTGAWSVVQIYSREFLNSNNIRYSNDRYAEDLPFFLKAVICSKDVSILDEPLYNYRKKVGKFTIDYPKFYESVFSAKEKARSILEEFNCKEYILENYLLYEIGSDKQALNTFAKADRKIRKDFYSRLREKFKKIFAENSEDVLRKSVGYEDFILILESKSYEEYRFRKFLRKISGVNRNE